MLNPEEVAALVAICGRKFPARGGLVLIPRTLRGNPEKLGQLVEHSHRKLGVIYAFIEVRDVAAKPTLCVSVTDVIHEADGQPVIERYELTPRECAALAGLGVDVVSLMEKSDLQDIGGTQVDAPPHAAALLAGHAFVHIDTNCLDVIQASLEEGGSVEWASFRIGHQGGALSIRAGVYLCLHWLSDSKLVHFHLATDDTIEALEKYSRLHINNTRRLCRIPSGPGFNRIDGRVLSKLIDHPLFNYYLAATSPKFL